MSTTGAPALRKAVASFSAAVRTSVPLRGSRGSATIRSIRSTSTRALRAGSSARGPVMTERYPRSALRAGDPDQQAHESHAFVGGEGGQELFVGMAGRPLAA